MSDFVFESTLSDEEIEKNFNETDFFSGIVEGLKEAIAYEKGTAKAETVVRKSSLPVVDVASQRKKLNLTQKSFAKILGVSPRTVEAWESGKSTPTPTAKNLLYLISLDPELILKLQ